MANKTITLADIRVQTWLVDRENERVIAHYDVLDDEGQVYTTGHAIFWRNIPEPGTEPDGSEAPIPDNWYQLPDQAQPDLGGKSYLQVLARLTASIEGGLAHLIEA